MRWKQLTLLLLLVTGIVLLFTRHWWLTPLLQQTPRLEDNADLIQTIEALVGLVNALISALAAYFLWLARTKDETQQEDELAPLRRTSADEIRARLGPLGGRVAWIDRSATRPGDLYGRPRLAIVGRSRQGKTREAAELIGRAVADLELVKPEQVYRPGAAFRFWSDASLRSELLKMLDVAQPALLFLDDLPHHFQGDALERLSAALDALAECKEHYVIVTARDDQMTPVHDAWLQRHDLHTVELPDLDDAQTADLIDNAAPVFDLRIDADARQVFVERNNGTPELPLMGLRQLRAESDRHVAQADAQRVMEQSIADAWARTRRLIVERQPAAAPLLDALGHFYAAGVRAAEPLVLHYAVRRWRQQAWLAPGRRWQLRRALTFLGRFDVTVQNGLIAHPDEVALGVDAKMVREEVGNFLLRHRRLFHRRGLRRLYRHGDAQRWALFDLGLGAENRQDHAAAIRYYTAAIRVAPHFGFHVNRGLARADLGQLDDALADYDEAIRLNPADATAYNNRGLARADLGQLDDALADYAEAIRLNPDDATAYYNRGNARYALGQLDDALADYAEAIRLNPDYATAYNNRGLARYALGQLDDALADYAEAIRLNPDYATAYNNRGLARYALGQLDDALADYAEAIRLNPDYANAYYNRGNARYALGQLDDALADYAEAIRLNPDYATAYYNRGNAYQQQGKLDAAAADLAQAAALFDTDSNKALAHSYLGHVLRQFAQWAEAQEAYQQAVALEPARALDWLGLADAARHRGDDAAWRAALVRARPHLDADDDYLMARLESVAGNVDAALDRLARAVAADADLAQHARRAPELHWVRDDPRFAAIVDQFAPPVDANADIEPDNL